MKKILFPTDFSPHASEVYHYALALADTFQSKILIMHAYGMPTHPRENADFEERGKSVLEALNAFLKANHQTEYQHINTECMAEIGFPAESILEAARDEKVDLIIMGTQGNTHALEKHLGMVSAAVLHKAPCPLLLIPPSAKFKTWARLACVIRFDFQDLFVMDQLRHWEKHFQATLMCLHVLEKEESVNSAQKKVDLLKKLFHNGSSSFEFEIQSGDLHTVIESFSKEKEVDMLAMVYHHKSFIGRLREFTSTKGVARKIHSPLLILNEI